MTPTIVWLQFKALFNTLHTYKQDTRSFPCGFGWSGQSVWTARTLSKCGEAGPSVISLAGAATCRFSHWYTFVTFYAVAKAFSLLADVSCACIVKSLTYSGPHPARHRRCALDMDGHGTVTAHPVIVAREDVKLRSPLQEARHHTADYGRVIVCIVCMLGQMS